MARNSGRTKPCSARTRRGRLKKAREFLDIAELAGTDYPDGCVSNAILSGIASADVICCIRVGEHSAGEDHQQAVDLLKRAHAPAAKHLDRLLRRKSTSAYSDVSSTAKHAEQALRDADALLEIATSLT
jgi:hypothetical protein